MMHSSQREDEMAQFALKRAIELGLTPALLLPLRYFEQTRPEYFQTILQPFLAQSQPNREIDVLNFSS
jgi:hypothetical protein